MDASDVFREEDFKSVRLLVSFQNLTTRTEIRDKSLISLVEFADATMTIEVPSKSCSPRHSVLIQVERPVRTKSASELNVVGSGKRPAKKFELLFEATGKVLEVEDTGDGADKIVIDLVQFDADNWKRFMAVFSERQNDIEKFFAVAKG